MHISAVFFLSALGLTSCVKDHGVDPIAQEQTTSIPGFRAGLDISQSSRVRFIGNDFTIRIGGTTDKLTAVAVYLKFCQGIDTVDAIWGDDHLAIDPLTDEWSFEYPDACPNRTGF